MKLKVKLSEIYKYQKLAESEMKTLQSLYETSIQRMFVQQTLWYRLYLWFRKMFHVPLSLRMYNGCESLMRMEISSRNALAKERALWHNYWSVKNQFTQAINSDERVWLSEFETETIMELRRLNK